MNRQEFTLYFTDREQDDFMGMSKWFRNIGIALLVIGILAVILPYVATLTVQVLVAVILLLAGVLQIAHAVSVRKWRPVFWEGLFAVLFLLTGLLFLISPMSGAFALTVILGIFFLILGAFKIQSAMAWRQRPGWGWMMTSGILSLILGVFVLAGLPGTALWVIGLILGIDLIFSGITAMVIGSRLKHLSAM